MRIFLTLIMVVFGLSACSGEWTKYESEYGPIQSVVGGVHVSDILTVNVYGEDELSGDYTVDVHGAIVMPLIGSIPVIGLDAEDISVAIESNLKKQGYLVKPDVTVFISKNSHFLIMGEVLNAGEFPYKNGMTVLDAVARAGGFSYRALQNEFDVIRKMDDGSEDVFSASLATKIYANDVVRVRERFF